MGSPRLPRQIEWLQEKKKQGCLSETALFYVQDFALRNGHYVRSLQAFWAFLD